MNQLYHHYQLNENEIIIKYIYIYYKPCLDGVSLAASANFSISSLSKSGFELSNELPYTLNDGASWKLPEPTSI